MPSPELKGKISLDPSEFIQGATRVTDSAKGIQGELENLFRRTGDIRPERALTGFIENLTGGNVAGAIESVTTRMTGLGLAGGAAVGAVGAGVGFLIKNIHEFDAALKDAQRTSKEAPLAGAAQEQIQEHVDATLKALEGLGSKWKSFWAEFAVAIPGTAGPEKLRQQHELLGVFTSDLDKSIAKQRESMENDAVAAAAGPEIVSQLKARTAAEEEYARIRKQKISEEEEIGKAHLPPELRSEARGAIGEAAQGARGLINERLASAGREASLQRDIAAIKLSTLPAGLQEAQIDSLVLANKERIRNSMGGINANAREALNLAIEQAKAERDAHGVKRDVEAFKPLFERSQLSFGELLGSSARTGNVNLDQAVLRAREAQREFGLAEQFRRRGDVDQAFRHELSGERIKSGIGVLKESEKLPGGDFRAAIDSAQIFRSIYQACSDTVAAVLSTRGGGDFSNK
jgi:hypothetical protein